MIDLNMELQDHLQTCRLPCHKGSYVSPKHRQNKSRTRTTILLGRNYPGPGAERPRTWGGSTVNLGRNDHTWGRRGADQPGADQLWGGSTVNLYFLSIGWLGLGLGLALDLGTGIGLCMENSVISTLFYICMDGK